MYACVHTHNPPYRRFFTEWQPHTEYDAVTAIAAAVSPSAAASAAATAATHLCIKMLSESSIADGEGGGRGNSGDRGEGGVGGKGRGGGEGEGIPRQKGVTRGVGAEVFYRRAHVCVCESVSTRESAVVPVCVRACTCARHLSDTNALDNSQHAATRCNVLQHIATHGDTLQHTATHCQTIHRLSYTNALDNSAARRSL